MIYSLILIPFAIGILFYFCLKNRDYQHKSLKIGSLVFSAIYFFRLFSNDYFESYNNSLLVIEHTGFRILFILWRVVTQGTIIILIIAPFFKNKYYTLITSVLAPLVGIVNLILLNVNVTAFLGSFSWTHIRTVQFIWECSLMIAIGVLTFIVKIKELIKIRLKDIGWAALIFFFVLLAIMPLFTITGLFGFSGVKATGFVFGHRILIYLAFLIPIILYIIFRNKSYEDRYLLLVTLSIAGFMTYFYKYNFQSFKNFSVWPLHLCNTAIILMLIAFVFRSKTFFYFNYFINVVGAIVAIVLPNTTGDLFLVSNIHFWVNHLFAFFLPILGVALKIFPRPNFKMVLGSIGVFSIYFIVVATINSWFLNYDSNVNYFFLNDDFIAKKITLFLKIRDKSLYTFSFNNLTFKIYPLYWATIYVGFVFLTFATWFIYDALYKVSDHHFDWHIRKKQTKLLLKSTGSIDRNEEFQMDDIKSSLKIHNFSKIYGKGKIKAVDDFSLEVHQGEIFGFLGHNGAGKSTVIKSLVGIQAITEGTIEVCGFDIQKNPLQAKLMMGYVPDNHAVYERLTGREYVYYIADLFLVTTKDRKERLDHYVKLFDLEDAIDQQIKTYSHGMKQKITVIAALIHNPKVWVLDEPLTGLDPTSSFQIKECMKEHAQAGNIVFFSSHVIEVVENICDRIAVIKKGKLVTVESIKSIKARGETLENIYLKYVNLKEEEGMLENAS